MADEDNCRTENNHSKNDVEMKPQPSNETEHESSDKADLKVDDGNGDEVPDDEPSGRKADEMHEEACNTDETVHGGDGDASRVAADGTNCNKTVNKSKEGEVGEEEQTMDEGDNDKVELNKTRVTEAEVGAQGDGRRDDEEDKMEVEERAQASDEATREEGDRGKRRQKRIRRNVMSVDTDEESDVSEEADKEEDNSAWEDSLMGKPYPKPRWNPVLAHAKRQRGLYKTPWAFSHHAIGSFGFVQRFERYCTLETHEGCVNTLHFNQAGDRLASGSDDLKVAIWDWAKKDPVLVYDSGHKRNVFQAKFMPNSGDTTLVSCARDGQVRVSELSSTGVCKITKRVAQHKAPAHKLGLQLDSPVIFMSCGEDAVVWNVDLREAKPTKALTVKEEEKKVPLYTIHINPSNHHEFMVGGRDKYLRIYDRRKLSASESEPPVKKYCPHHLIRDDSYVNVTCSVYSYDGQELLVSYNDDEIYLFDNSHSDGSDYIHQYQGHRNNATVKGVNFYGARSEFVVSGSDCGNVFLWSKETERIVQLMHGDEGGVVNCLEPHPSAPILATSGLDHDVKVWMPTAQEPVDIKKHAKTLRKNRLEREEEKNREPSQLESQMFMFLLQHLRRSNRRQAREEDDDLESDDDPSSESEDEDDDEDDDWAQQVACAQS